MPSSYVGGAPLFRASEERRWTMRDMRQFASQILLSSLMILELYVLRPH